jgi:multiple antibiotic resistance protein
MLDWAEYSKLFIGLLAIVNPVGAIPIYLGMLERSGGQVDYPAAARTTTLAVAGVLFAALASGELLLRIFGISLAAFRVAGGILLLLMGIEMLSPSGGDQRHRRTLRDSGDGDGTAVPAPVEGPFASISVVPLGMPLLAGPGAISTLIVYADRGTHAAHYVVLASIVALVTVVVYLCLRSAPRVGQLAGRTGLQIITRLMGLVTTAIGVEIMGNGLAGLFPVLRGSG